MASIVIGGLCLQSLPCQHNVTVDGRRLGRMLSVQIAALLAGHGLWPPAHYLVSVGWLRRAWLLYVMWCRRLTDWRTGAPPRPAASRS